MPLTKKAFREAASRYATGVVVATTISDGADHAMTASSFTTVSLDPMLVLVCVQNDSRFCDALLDSDHQQWAISVLPADAQGAASWFATKGRPLHGQFDRFAHHRGAATGAIVLDSALATMELMVAQTHPAGDHMIVIGEVLSLGCRLDRMGDIDPQPSDLPLVYWARRYRNLAP